MELWLDIQLQWGSMVTFLAIDPARLTEPDMVVRIALQVLLLFGSAFFSGSETALFSLSRLDLHGLRKEKSRTVETLHALLDQPRRLIISILLGNELVNIAAAANMAGILVTLYGVEYAGWINIFIMVPLLLLFGEVTPKTIAASNPVKVSSRFVAHPMAVWLNLVAPLRWTVRGVADRITTWLVGEEKAAENILQIDEFRSLVEAVAREGELDSTERALIYNLLEAGDTEIVEAMTPRIRIDFIDGELPVEQMIDCFRQLQHPRTPVFSGHRDNLIGFLHAEDVLRLVMDKTDLSSVDPMQIIRPPVVVPPTKKVDEMFDFFQANQARAAIVLNEFGGVDGMITMKDVLTFIFGQITGQVQGEELYRYNDENEYEVPGDMKLTDFNNLTNFGIDDPRMTTIGGVLFRHLDRLPQVGDQAVSPEGVVIRVLEMEAHQIVRVHVSIGGGESEEEVQDEEGEEGEEDEMLDKEDKVA